MLPLPVVNWANALSAIFTVATVAIIVVYHDRMHNRLIAGLVLVLVSSSLLSIGSIASLAFDTTLASFVLSGAALVLFLSLWLDDEAGDTTTNP